MPDRAYYLTDSAAHGRPAHQVPAAHRRDAQAGRLRRRRRARRARSSRWRRRSPQSHATREDSADVLKAQQRLDPRRLRSQGARHGLGRPSSRPPGCRAQHRFIVWHPSAITGAAALVAASRSTPGRTSSPSTRSTSTPALLPKAFADQRFAFYGKALSGTPQQRVRWKRARRRDQRRAGRGGRQACTSSATSRPRTRRACSRWSATSSTAFSKRIDKLDWMAPATARRPRKS